MASLKSRLIFRAVVTVLYLVLMFYVGRPMYWKISATFHDIRANKQSFSGGIYEIIHEAKKQVGWIQYGSHSGRNDQKTAPPGRRGLHQIS